MPTILVTLALLRDALAAGELDLEIIDADRADMVLALSYALVWLPELEARGVGGEGSEATLADIAAAEDEDSSGVPAASRDRQRRRAKGA